MSKITKIIDEFSNAHHIEKNNELGRGGQGVVYKTKDADTVIKIALKNGKPIKDKKEISLFHQKIKELIYKPLPNDINITKPLVVLKDEAGYVMNLLDAMEPFAILLPQKLPKEKASELTIPDFLYELSQKNERTAIYITYYLQTGGLRKRLYSLSRLAVTLCRLHLRGIVYFDVSHNNVFINRDDVPLVYLIDADNIEYESLSKDSVRTEDFEVPEVVRGEVNSTYSDIYAFGVLSFLTLTTTHPFDGGGNAAGSWDSDESNNKKQWELPWIEDSKNDSNRNSDGLRGALSVTEELNRLFHKLFEDGKEDKYKRPTLPLWIESLEKAACKTIKCLNCSMSYYDDKFDQCPYCDAKKPKRVVVKSYYYNNDIKLQERWQYTKEILDNAKKIEIPNYIFKSFDVLNLDDIFLEIKFPNKTRVEFSFNKSDENIYFESKKPMVTLNKRVELAKLENGVSMIIESDITTLVEINIAL